MSADRKALIREYAQRRAQECIDDWAHEGAYENNETWGTDFSDEEMRELIGLASRVRAVLP